ncbi:hypothetical protein JTE90_025219 [Oedothorax gibbosus]|uniref:Uncharacterized protein n=1 Tax=Oedothorax gibbosus TaxID=931172 RepID=A0AAV6UTN4_9ARAC|nr:hypothetical protein JTE90_025219 [Oedothorax gibbosus]
MVERGKQIITMVERGKLIITMVERGKQIITMAERGKLIITMVERGKLIITMVESERQTTDCFDMEDINLKKQRWLVKKNWQHAEKTHNTQKLNLI